MANFRLTVSTLPLLLPDMFLRLTFLRLTVKICQFLRLTAKFLAILRLAVQDPRNIAALFVSGKSGLNCGPRYSLNEQNYVRTVFHRVKTSTAGHSVCV